MIELAFDIASGANYKFNTALFGEQASGRCTRVLFIDSATANASMARSYLAGVPMARGVGFLEAGAFCGKCTRIKISPFRPLTRHKTNMKNIHLEGKFDIIPNSTQCKR